MRVVDVRIVLFTDYCATVSMTVQVKCIPLIRGERVYLLLTA